MGRNHFINQLLTGSICNISIITGQISAQRCIIEAFTQKKRANEGVDIFIEECLVRRELSDNFCYYNENYDNISGKFVNGESYF